MKWIIDTSTGAYYAKDKDGTLYQRPMLQDGSMESESEICEIDIHQLGYFELLHIKKLVKGGE